MKRQGPRDQGNEEARTEEQGYKGQGAELRAWE